MDDILVHFASTAIFLSLHWSQNFIILAQMNLKIITVRNAASEAEFVLILNAFNNKIMHSFSHFLNVQKKWTMKEKKNLNFLRCNQSGKRII